MGRDFLRLSCARQHPTHASFQGGGGGGQTSSNSAMIASAAFCVVTPASSIFLIPRTYLAKSVDRMASMGALSTATMSLTMAGEPRASVMAVLAPLLRQSATARGSNQRSE